MSELLKTIKFAHTLLILFLTARFQVKFNQLDKKKFFSDLKDF